MASNLNSEQLKFQLSSRFPNAFSGKKSEKPSVQKFNLKYNNQKYDMFTSTDWILYFQLKAEEQSFTYRPQSYRNDHCVLKSIMTKYKPSEIKDMIDFIWESKHDLRPKYQCGIYLLSKKWIASVWNYTQAWKAGEYLNNSQWQNKKFKKPKRRREWDSKKIETKNDEIYI